MEELGHPIVGDIVNVGGVAGKVVSMVVEATIDGVQRRLDVQFPFKDTVDIYYLSDLVWDETNDWYNLRGKEKKYVAGQILTTLDPKEIIDLKEIALYRSAIKKMTDELLTTLWEKEKDIAKDEDDAWIMLRKKYGWPDADTLNKLGLQIVIRHNVGTAEITTSPSKLRRY